MDILRHLNITPVQRNSGIDGFLKEYIYNKPVSLKIQREDETLEEAANRLLKASKIKQCSFMILIRTDRKSTRLNSSDFNTIPDNMRIIDSYEVQIDTLTDEFKKYACESY